MDRPKIVDISGRILDELGIEGVARLSYRNFIKKLAKLWKEGRVIVKFRAPIKSVLELLRECGIRYYKVTDYEAYWIRVKNEDTLVKVYSIIWGLNADLLYEIISKLKKYEVLYVL